MTEKHIPIKPDVKVVIHAHKHAEFDSHELAEVLVTGPGASEVETQFQEEENSLFLEMFKEGTITLPRDTQVNVQTIGGHGEVRGLPQGLVGIQIGGHLKVQDSGPINIEQVGGHVKVRHLTGDLHLDHVGGHLKVGPCTGSVSALHVGGHAELVDVIGGCNLPEVGGHAKLDGVKGGQKVNAGGSVKTHIDPLPNLPYEINAGGPLTCDLPSTANATVRMHGPGVGSIFSPSRSIGDGSAQVRLSAGGPISLTEDGVGSHRDDLKRGIKDTVRAAQAKAKAKVQEVLDESNLTQEMTADLHEQFAEIAHEAIEVVKEISEDVQEKAREVWKKGTMAQATTNKEEASDVVGTEDVTTAKEEERKMILRMLAEGKITVEEASDLLQTLN